MGAARLYPTSDEKGVSAEGKRWYLAASTRVWHAYPMALVLVVSRQPPLNTSSSTSSLTYVELMRCPIYGSPGK